MAAITVTLTESPYQKHSGIPSVVSLDTNIPATIFYTLDETEPTIASNVYVGPIDMPAKNTVVLKFFATDGTDSSSIVTEVYRTDLSSARNSHDKILNYNPIPKAAIFPYGSPSTLLEPGPVYGGVGGPIVDDQLDPRVSDGYDGFGNPTLFYTPPKSQFDFVFSETNSIGERGRGIGTLPANVSYIRKQAVPISSDANSAYFNPKALVIYHDSGEEPYDDGVVRINRAHFSLESADTVRDKRLLTNVDRPAPSGSLLRQLYNPRDNTITYYYYDNRVGRWIISKEPYTSSQSPAKNLHSVVFSSRSPGDKYVYEWIPFKYSRIFT